MTDADAPDAFDAVGHPVRVDALRALADAHREAAPEDARVTYSDLRERVGVRDSGNFNYHLDCLGGLVEKTDGGYRLTRVGMRVVSALRSGFFDTDWTWGPVAAPGDCWVCGDALALRYEDGALHVTCGDDSHALALYVPPSLVQSQPADRLPEQVAFLENRWGGLTWQGICSECHGRVDGAVRKVDAPLPHWAYHGDCGRCGFQHVLPVGLYLLGHPDVRHFYLDHGVDVRTEPFWTLECCRPGAADVADTDPLRLVVDVTESDETLSLTVDRDGDVVGSDRQ